MLDNLTALEHLTSGQTACFYYFSDCMHTHTVRSPSFTHTVHGCYLHTQKTIGGYNESR